MLVITPHAIDPEVTGREAFPAKADPPDEFNRPDIRWLDARFQAVKTDFGKGIMNCLADRFLHQPASCEIDHSVIAEIGTLESLERNPVQVDYTDDVSGSYLACDKADIRVADEPRKPGIETFVIRECLQPRLMI